MQALKPSSVSIYTCTAKLKATVGQRIAAFRGETNQMWHVLTALMYNDLSSFRRERSLAQRRSEDPRARNASQSSGALFWPFETFILSVTWNKTFPFPTNREKTAHFLPERHIWWYVRIKIYRACKILFSLLTWFTEEDSTFKKLYWSSWLSDANLTEQI